MNTGRVNLAFTIESRDGSTDSETRLVNAYVDLDGQIRRVIKRPALVNTYSVSAGHATAPLNLRGQGMLSYATESAPGLPGTTTLMAVRGDTITVPIS